MQNITHSKSESMIVEASKYIKEGEIVFTGIGRPIVSSMLAQKTHAPNVTIIVETGVINPQFKSLPLSVGEPRVMRRATMFGSLREMLGCVLQKGMVDVGFLGGAQIDPYANLNSTVIGDYYRPKVRFSGSGGANPIASLSKRLLIITPHQKRRFARQCDYITSPGYIDGPYGRKNAGLKMWNPDITIITDLCVMNIDPTLGKLILLKLMPGVTVERVIENTTFELNIPPEVGAVNLPTETELSLLREIDPQKIFIAE